MLTVAGLLYAAVSLFGIFHRVSVGLICDDAGVITSITKDSPAARAGLNVGDRVDLTRVDAATRYALTSAPAQLLQAAYTLQAEHRGITRTYHLAAVPLPVDAISPWKRPISALLVLTAGLLVVLRPQRATWALLGYALVTTMALDNMYLPYPWMLYANFAGDFVEDMPAAALVLFAIWFLRPRPRWWHLPLSLAVIAFGIISGFRLWLSVSQRTAVPFGSASEILDILIALVTIAVLVDTFWSGRPENRQRVAWVIAAFSFAVIFEIVVPDFIDISGRATVTPAFVIAYTAWSISPLVVAAVVLYSMTRYRVVDLRIAISRALVYSVTTFVIVAIFALIEWAAAKLFEGSNVTTYAAVVAVLLIGFASNSLHKQVDNVVDTLFFAKLKAAERRLRLLAASLLHTDSEETIAKFLIEEPARALDLISAALFIEAGRGQGFARIASVGWQAEQTSLLERTDEIVPQMRAAEGALSANTLTWTDEHFPQGVEAPLLAIPLKAHGDLFGIALYGGHTDGAFLNEDECVLLDRLAQNAAAAYDHIEATRARREIERLETDLARLHTRLQPD